MNQPRVNLFSSISHNFWLGRSQYINQFSIAYVCTLWFTDVVMTVSTCSWVWLGAVVDRGPVWSQWCGWGPLLIGGWCERRAVLQGPEWLASLVAIFRYRELISRYREMKKISRYPKINSRYLKIISRYRETDYFPISEIDFPISGIRIPDIGKCWIKTKMAFHTFHLCTIRDV